MNIKDFDVGQTEILIILYKCYRWRYLEFCSSESLSGNRY